MINWCFLGQCTVPPGYQSYGANPKYYRIGSYTTTQKNAENECSSEGAWLAMPKTSAEMGTLTYLINCKLWAGWIFFKSFAMDIYLISATLPDTWIGVRTYHHANCQNSTCDSKMVWQDGSPFTFTPSMVSMVKNNAAKENCMRYRLAIASFDDNQCSRLYSFICEYDCANPNIFNDNSKRLT